MPLQVAQISVGVTANTQQATAQLNSFKGALTGVGGSVQSFTQYMMLSGQAMGPWQSGLYMASQGLRQMATAASFAQGSIMALTAAMGAVAALAVRFGAPIQQGMQQLQVALDNNGLKWDDMASSIDKAVSSGEHFGRQAGESYQALAILITTTHSAEAATHNLALVQDLAARTGMTLAAAANIVARAYEGYGRSLQQYTDGFKFVRPSIDAAAKSQDALDKATATYDSHLQTLNNHLANQADRAGAASLKVDQLARAQQGLADTYQQIADAQARQAIDDMVPRISAQQGATESLAAAQARLARDTAEIANRPPYQSNLTDATDKLTIAQIRLQEAQQKQATSAQTSHADYRKLVDLQTVLAEAQQRLQTAQGADIGDAQANLSNAIARQRTELDQMHDTVRNTLADRASLIQAEMNVRDAILAVNAARAADAAQATGTAPGQVSDRQRLIDDATAVANAQRDLDRAVLVDQQDAARKALETTITQRDAARSVADAEQRITDAVNQQSAAGISGGAAQRTIDQERIALAKEHDALMQKILNNIMAQAELDAQNKHNQEGLDKAAANLAGSADAAGKGWSGMLKRISAEIADWLGSHVAALQGGFLALLGVDALFPKLLPGLMSGIGRLIASAATSLAGGLSSVVSAAGAALAPVAIPAAVVAGAIAGSLLIDAAFKRLPKVVQDVTGPLELPFKQIASAAKDSATVIMDVVHGDWGKALNDLGGLFAHQFENFWSAWSSFFGRIGGMLASAVGSIASGISGMWGKVTEAFSVAKAVVLDAMKGAGEWLLDVGRSILRGLWNGVLWVKDNIIAALFTPQDWLLNLIKTPLLWLFNIGVDVIQGMWDGITTAWEGTFTALFDLSQWLWNLIENADVWLVDTGLKVISGMWKGIQDNWTLLFTGGFKLAVWIGRLIEGADGWLLETGQHVIRGLWDGIIALWNDLFERGLNIAQWIKNKIGDGLDWLGDIGGNIVRGLWDGITGAWDWFIDKLYKAFHNSFIGKLLSFFGISSPSRLMADMGKNIVLGLHSGIMDTFPVVHSLLDDEFNKMMGVGASASFGGLSAGRGGVVTVQNITYHVNVEGSVQTEADLTRALRDNMVDAGRRNGGNYLAGVA